VKDYTVSVYSPSAVSITDSNGKTNDPSLTLYAPVVNYTNPLNATLYNTTTTTVATTTTTTTTTTPTTTTVTVPTVTVTDVTTNYTTTDDTTTVTFVPPVFNLTSTLVLTPVPVVVAPATVIIAMNATETLAALKSALAVAKVSAVATIYDIYYGSPYTLYSGVYPAYSPFYFAQVLSPSTYFFIVSTVSLTSVN